MPNVGGPRCAKKNTPVGLKDTMEKLDRDDFR